MAIAGRVAIVPKGEWNSSISYEKLDAVSYNNALYMAKKPSVGQVPADGEYWMLCVQSIDYAEFEKIINGTTTVGIADKANKDKNGDDIADTYAKKNDLTNFQNKDGDSKDNTVTFESSDSTTADSWTDVAVLATGEKHSSLFAKISTMFKNIRYIYTHFIKIENILDTLEEIVANTQSGKVAGALAVKELNSNLGKIGTESVTLTALSTTNINSAVGSYIKIGRIVIVNAQFRVTNAVTNGVALNVLSGLPETANSYGAELNFHDASISQGTSQEAGSRVRVSAKGYLIWDGVVPNANQLFIVNGCYISKI